MYFKNRRRRWHEDVAGLLSKVKYLQMNPDSVHFIHIMMVSFQNKKKKIYMYSTQLKPWKLVPYFTPGHIIVLLVCRVIPHTSTDEGSANLYLCMLINDFPGCDGWRYKMQIRLLALASCPHASPRVSPQRQRRSVVPCLFWGEPWIYIFMGLFLLLSPTARLDFAL